MTDHKTKEWQKQARTKAKALLSKSASFQELGRAEQFSLYKDIVDSEYQNLAQKEGGNGIISKQMANQGASSLIDDSRHKIKASEIGAGLDEGVDFIEKVDFPEFVKDLLKGVFDANAEVMQQQTEDYMRLVKASTQSLSEFIKEISKADSFAYLAENDKEGGFNLGFEDDINGGGQKVILTDKDGNPVDTEDSKIKAKIMDAQIALAKERRAMLRETILMGVNRLVIEKGKVRAAVKFDIKAQSKTVTKDQATKKDATTSQKVNRKGGGFYSFYRNRTSDVTNKRSTSISISSAAGQQSTAVSAALTGEVEINFKSDYFKLDNFADLYRKDDKE